MTPRYIFEHSAPPGVQRVPVTPFPSRLLDEAMPVLSDTEWRVLCVVVRQTLGWSDGKGGRKGQDWLTQSQLKARTGRASEAVSRAIDGLVRKGWLAVMSEEGDMLATPQERRSNAGRLLFGLPPETAKIGQSGSSVFEVDSSETELRKPNTTKEILYKNIPYNARRRQAESRGDVFEPLVVYGPSAEHVAQANRADNTSLPTSNPGLRTQPHSPN